MTDSQTHHRPANMNPRNLLAQETSPYLLQHRHNPVDWRAWNAAALAEAKALDRPILLSVGYAACHWCHVMAHESFEDAGIAALMNALFVNIKVDREERPDLDQIYQQALSLLGTQGGWPLTMFLTPDGAPFWGGTYFPREARYGRPGFGDVLRALADAYHNDRAKVVANVGGIATAMQRLAAPQPGEGVTDELADRIAERLLQEIDTVHGGISGAPKFPQAPILNLLWRAWRRTGDARHRDAVLLSLTRMVQGGIWDHLGGGLARYSTDAQWLVPHFEKMLYDNAELLSLLCDAHAQTGEALFAARAAEIVGWLGREMLAEADAAGNRAFAASLDADSEGEEGRFYVWSAAEVADVLGAQAGFFGHVYDISEAGNWEGVNILTRSHQEGLLPGEDENRLATARASLLARRALRVRPGRDDKVLADWNGLMIAALARASLVFGRKEWLDLALGAFAFVAGSMREDGRLRHSFCAGRLAHPATLDDHANLARAALALFDATGSAGFLDEARRLVADLERHHRHEGGGYFFTADDTTDVIIRTISANDNATPSGNGTMAEVLSRLARITGKDSYLVRCEELLQAFAGEAGRNFFPLATWLNGSDFHRNALDVVIAGERGEPATEALLRAFHRTPAPTAQLFVVADGSALPPAHPAHGKVRTGGAATAYLCRNRACSAPVTEADALSALLRGRA